MIVLEFTNDPGEVELFEKLKIHARLSRWNDDPHWGQTGVLWFGTASELFEALKQTGMQ